MANYVKGTIKYMPAVDQINRKFALRKTKVGNGYNRYMGGMTTERWVAGKGHVSRNAMFFREYNRTTAPSEAEIAQRLAFGEGVRAGNRLLKDLSVITRYQEMFYEAADDFTKRVFGVSAEGYDYRGWMIACQIKAYLEDKEGKGTWPQSFDA